MLPTPQINYLAVLVISIAAYAIGALWHGPLFGKLYMKLVALKPMPKEKMMAVMKKMMTLGFFATLFYTFMAAHFVSWFAAETFFEGGFLGFLFWFAFIVPMLFSGYLWENKSLKLFCFNACFRLVEIVIITGLLAVW